MGRAWAAFVGLLVGLPLLLAACDGGGPYRQACDELCTTLSVDCELPGYETVASCTPNCEQEMEQADDPEDLLDCYDDAGCSVVDLIECARLRDADRL